LRFARPAEANPADNATERIAAGAGSRCAPEMSARRRRRITMFRSDHAMWLAIRIRSARRKRTVGEVRIRLAGGGNRVRTIGPAEKETAVERGPAADHLRLARRPVLNDPIQLIGPASPFGNSRETLRKSGTDGSNPALSSGESTANLTKTPPKRGQ
jgi:hypothetical protein